MGFIPSLLFSVYDHFNDHLKKNKLAKQIESNSASADDYWELVNIIGSEESNKDRHPACLHVIRKLLEKFPNHTEGNMYEPELLILVGSYEEAIPKLEKLIIKYPNSAMFNFLLGKCYSTSGNNVKAKEFQDKSIALEKDSGKKRYSYDGHFLKIKRE